MSWLSVLQQRITQVASADPEYKIANSTSIVAKSLKELGAKTIIRLNGSMYRAECFTSQGFNHVELFFEDGTVPSAVPSSY